jgi:4-amino-4-deoxy-L-arabinose transferase-like glycosyltransferase
VWLTAIILLPFETLIYWLITGETRYHDSSTFLTALPPLFFILPIIFVPAFFVMWFLLHQLPKEFKYFKITASLIANAVSISTFILLIKMTDFLIEAEVIMFAITLTICVWLYKTNMQVSSNGNI